MVGKLDDMLNFQQTALSLREQRQQLLASNIANADTPNYKARDIDFNKALQGALARSGSDATSAASSTASAASSASSTPGELTKTSFTHLSASAASSNTIDGAPLLYSNPQQGSIDGNTVDMDVQRNAFTDNAMRYEASVTFISSKIKTLLTAIQGQ